MKADIKYDIVLIRHAQSLFNEAAIRETSRLGLSHLSWEELIEDVKFNKHVTYNQLYMDPPLSEAGRKQCEYYKHQCQKISPDLILVSPYRRALETCHRLFGKTTVPVIVEPILSEVFRFSCDVPEKLDTIKSDYSSFDFTKVQSLGDDWYLQNLVPQYRSKIKQNLKHEDHSENRKILLNLLAERRVRQEPKMLRSRAAGIKRMLQSYKQKYPKIVVVAHYYIIQFVKSVGFDENNDLVEYQDIRNCHPYYENLEELTKII